METRRFHPWWVHLPALLIWGALVVVILKAWPWPERTPLQFDFAGNPTRWGSATPLALFLILFSLFFIALSAGLDEAWARAEKGQRFNWLTIMDEATIGFVAGIGIAQFGMMARGETRLPNIWPLTLTLMIGGTVAALLLEAKRPRGTTPPAEKESDVETLEAELAQRMAGRSRWTYWEAQNPVWMSLQKRKKT